MRYFVYIHRRASDNRIFYVGKGCRYRHKSKWNRSQHWHNIVNKHGYTIEIVKNNLSETEAFNLECELIQKYKSDGLCNRTNGGEGSSGVVVSAATRAKLKEQRWTEAWRSNISRKAKERFSDPAYRAANCIRIKKQMSDPDLRKRLREKTLAHFSDPKVREISRQKTLDYYRQHPWARDNARRKALARFNTPEKRAAHAQAKAVLCVETGAVFGTGTLAAEWIAAQGIYKGDNSSIAKVCRGEKKTAFGYHWRYVKRRSKAKAKPPQADLSD